jgi:hypothetical protein
MEKIILKIGPKFVEMNLTTWDGGSAITLDGVREDNLDKKQVHKTRIIGSLPDGRVLRRSVSETTNRG